MTYRRITGHYRAANIYAIGEWAIGEIKRRGRERRAIPAALYDLAEWTQAWLSNDPRDNGGDGWPRREMRPEWRDVYRDYLNLRDRCSFPF